MKPGGRRSTFDLRRFAVPILVVASLSALVGCSDVSEPQPVGITSATLSGDEKSITVTWVGGGCDELDTFNAEIDGAEARVTLSLSVAVEGGDCPAVAIYRDARLELAGPLGDRELVDGASGRPLTPERE